MSKEKISKRKADAEEPQESVQKPQNEKMKYKKRQAIQDPIEEVVDECQVASLSEDKKRADRLEKKKLRVERKATKPNSEGLYEAKAIWSMCRRKDLDEKERGVKIHELFALLRGTFQEVFLV